MRDRVKELTRKTLIITLGRVSTQFISFLLLPLYTALLTTEEYGAVDFVMTLVQLLVPIVSVMIDQGVFRYLLNSDSEEEKRKTVSSAFFVLLITSGVSCCALFIISLFTSHQYIIWLLLIIIVTAFSNLFLQIARGLKRTGDYSLGSFVCSGSTIILNVLCIASLHLGAEGMLIATFWGNMICCCFLLLRLRIFSYITLCDFDREVAVNELKYAVPLVPNQLSIWVLNGSDRLIVTFLLGAAANGILAVSHKFPAVYMTIFNLFLLAWHETGALHYYDEDRDTFFTDMFNKLFSIFATLCMAIMVVLPIVFNWFVNSSYQEAFLNIPIYLIASLFNVVVGLLGVVYVATKKTAEIAKTTIVAAIINIVAHVVLINHLGLFAASISTLIGYGVAMVTRVKDTKRYLKIRYDIKQLACIGVALVFCMYIYYLDNKIVSTIFLPFFIIGAYFFNRELVNELVKFMEQKINGRINKKWLASIVVSIFIVISVFAGAYIFRKHITTTVAIDSISKDEINEVNALDIIKFEEFGAKDFTCTGLTYDVKDNAFWIGDYGATSPRDQVRPRIVEVDRSFSKILKSVELSPILGSMVDLQGVAYDGKLDYLWLALGNSVVAIDKDGTLINSIELRKYSKCKFNGICYDEGDDSLWVLCASQYLLHIGKDGSVIDEFPFNYADQDHLCMIGDYLYVTVGADYRGTNNYVCKVSPKNGEVLSLYRVLSANSLEGIVGYDDKVLILNDGLYHTDLIGHSYFSVFDMEYFQIDN